MPDHLTRTALARDLAEVIVRRDHPLAGRAVVTPRDLADEDWIATPEGSICRQWLLRMYDGTGRLPRIAHVAMEFDSHLALVRAGLGIALIPGSAARPSARTWRPCRSPTRCRAARSSRCTAAR